METVIIVIHLMIVIALVGAVLIQKSEGGALGIGGGGGFMSSRGTANVLTRTTGFLAAGFFATSLLLGVLASSHRGERPSSILDKAPAAAGAPATPGTPAAPGATPAPGTGQGGVLDQLMQQQQRGPAAPANPQ
ncbi:preprotein translocase subunit SecG [Prosthecodimorpha staleyi]|uniref:Protein-export membrane protein SecG n=1 Tax=Prosthecodimorpha staleyi TaxID=2840188 RepID=A0A947D920_9HYPH|nr:preprotein translocase subunit SecG [Prosthecodimorpha staleyi]MBT9292613.1 preprotein translocase subunit SecG [Prosthecodimorpha staleyi]